MGTKSNLRSFRFSDEVYCILEQQAGDNLNAKFENLVTDCYCKIEQRQAELERVNAQINQRREVLRNLEKATAELSQLERDIVSAKHYFGIVERRAKSISEQEM